MSNIQIRPIALVLSIGLGLSAAGCGYLNLGRGGTAEAPPSSPEAVETGNDASRPDGDPAGDTDATASAPAASEADAALPGADSASSVSDPATPYSGRLPVSRYRVQVYSITDRDSAEAALNRVKRYLADWSYGVYLEEEGGYFKIRVGDFIDKDEADLLRDRLRREGYPDAWTATSRTNVP